jgi:ubiquinone/menaquinone biosynthesis C-methylase UbiE
MKSIFFHIYNFIIGKHPNNTIFSFNFHNIKHLVKFNKKIADSHLIKENSSFLDVGGGASPYFDIYKQKIKDFHVLDFKESLPKNEKRPIEQVEGVAESIPFKSQSFDVVLFNQVLEHVSNDTNAISEVHRVLKQGGVLVGSVPHISPIHLEPYDFRRYTYYGLEKILKEHHFKQIKIESNGGVYKTLALTLLMDWFLSVNNGEKQRFNVLKHFMLFPLTGLINFIALIADLVSKNKKRSPTNYCWIAFK